MSKRIMPPTNCLAGGCSTIGFCSRCGFDDAENERRKELPLVLCRDGLRRKIIPRKDQEQEEATNE